MGDVITSNIPSEGYTPGTKYTITATTKSSPTRNMFGFQISPQSVTGTLLGTITITNSTQTQVTGGGKYVTHRQAGINGTNGVKTWSFDWTAPATNVGELTAYYVMNKSNSSESSSGDEIFLGSTAIPPFNVSIAENPLEKAYKVSYNNLTKQVSLNYSLFDNAKVVLNVQDLSGRLIQSVDFGYKTAGDYSEQVTINNLDISGMYVVSLFINNRVLNRKLMINN